MPNNYWRCTRTAFRILCLLVFCCFLDVSSITINLSDISRFSFLPLSVPFLIERPLPAPQSPGFGLLPGGYINVDIGIYESQNGDKDISGITRRKKRGLSITDYDNWQPTFLKRGGRYVPSIRPSQVPRRWNSIFSGLAGTWVWGSLTNKVLHKIFHRNKVTRVNDRMNVEQKPSASHNSTLFRLNTPTNEQKNIATPQNVYVRRINDLKLKTDVHTLDVRPKAYLYIFTTEQLLDNMNLIGMEVKRTEILEQYHRTGMHPSDNMGKEISQIGSSYMTSLYVRS